MSNAVAEFEVAAARLVQESEPELTADLVATAHRVLDEPHAPLSPVAIKTLEDIVMFLDAQAETGHAVACSAEDLARLLRRDDLGAERRAYLLYLMSQRHTQLGRVGRAVEVVGELVAIARVLTRSDPDQLPMLAAALGQLAELRRACGDRRDAAVAATESVSLWRRLAASETRHHVSLAAGLNNLAGMLVDADRAATMTRGASHSR